MFMIDHVMEIIWLGFSTLTAFINLHYLLHRGHYRCIATYALSPHTTFGPPC